MNSFTTPNAPLNVYLIGNNPIDLSSIYDKIRNSKYGHYKAEICFELKGLFRKIKRFQPACILIDDNVDRRELKKMIKDLTSRSFTRNIPITIIKNSNYSEGISEAQEYLLKDQITSDGISRSIINAIKMKKMQAYILQKYARNRSRLSNLFS